MTTPLTREQFTRILGIAIRATSFRVRVEAHDALLAHDAALRARLAEAEAALREVEAHHVAQNTRKGRDEARSTTLRIVRRVLAPERPA